MCITNVNVNNIQYWQCQSFHSSVFVVNCENISNFVLFIDFEQVNVCLVNIEKAINFEDKIRYIMRYISKP